MGPGPSRPASRPSPASSAFPGEWPWYPAVWGRRWSWPWLWEAPLPGAPLPRQLRSARTAAVLLTTLFYFQDLLLRAPWLTVAAGAAGFCARIYILLRLWQLSRAMAPAPEASI